MAFNYDLEAGKVKFPQAIASAEELAGKMLPQLKDDIMEGAKEANAPKLTKLCETASNILESFIATYKSAIGADGDSPSEGTMQGGYTFIKKTDEAVNG